jgi:membrane protein implicated in regulation of membrane protease activity
MHTSEVAMKYLVALIIPPLALLWIGKPAHFVLNACLWIISIPLTLMFGVFAILWLACIAHAVGMCMEHDAERHHSPEDEDTIIVLKH